MSWNVKHCPETPALEEVEFSGHVWVQELPTGGEFRLQVAPSGFVTFATTEQSFDTVAAVPPQFRRAAELINERLDRDALEAATEDPSSVTFCGIATRNEGVAYDWDSVPPFVGVDIWSEQKEKFLSPDAAAGVFDRLGLPTLPAIEKELAAAHADFTRYADQRSFPQSAWRNGQAAGVLIRDKSGTRAVAWRHKQDRSPVSQSHSASDLAAEYATDARIEQAVTELRASDHSVTVDTIRDRLIADVARESYRYLFADDTFVTSLSTFRSAVAERVQQHQFKTE
jgi:hypothetical protein